MLIVCRRLVIFLPLLLLLTAIQLSSAVEFGDKTTAGDCSPILAKIDADVTIICSDPLAIKAVESLIQRVESLSLDNKKNQEIIETQLKSIEALIEGKRNASNPEIYDQALEDYVKGNNRLIKQLLSELKKTKYDALFSEKSGYAAWPEIKDTRRFILSSFVNDATCPEDNGMFKSVMKISIRDGKVKLKMGRHKFKAVLSQDRKTITASAKHKDGDGITAISGEARIRKDGSVEGEFPWVWTNKSNSYQCAGTTVLSSIDN